jgi:hypothetical protein
MPQTAHTPSPHQHSYPDKWNRFSRNSRNTCSGNSLGSAGQPGAEFLGSAFALDGGGLMFLDGLVLGGEFGLHYAGYSADAQGSAHQAEENSVQCGVGEYFGGDQGQ